MDEYNDDTRKSRKRTKKLLNSIQEQLDFYFGNANLHHDRFLRKEIEENEGGFICLETLLKFNTLKQIVSEKAMLIKAIEISSNLQLNEDKTKVKRITPLPPLDQNEVDSRTVYVDQLHAYCNHTWIRHVFSTCGTVEYISLPRFKHDNSIKGFAFVEFSTKEEAEKACRILNTAEGCKNKAKKRHSTDKETVEEPSSTTATPTKTRRKRSVSVSESENDTKQAIKRKRSVSECSEGSPSKIKKKRKTSLEECSLSEIKDKILNEKAGPSSENTKINTVDPLTVKKTVEQNQINNKSGDEKKETTKKKIRKHSKKDKQQKEIYVAPMYVISKKEWTTLKNKYKKLQTDEYKILKNNTRIIKSERVRRKELKMKLNEQSQKRKTPNNESIQDSKSRDTNVQKYNSGKPQGKKESSLVPKETGTKKTDETPEKIDAKENKPKEKSMKKHELVPGTVARISTTDENLTKDIIRKSLTSIADIAYVDYLNGAPKGYVRFKNEGMRTIVMETSDEMKEGWKFKVEELQADEEKAYLQKALEDQKKRYELNAKKKKKREERGMSKVLRLAEEIAD